MSESAFADLDANKTYQYRAFGVPELALKRSPEQELVVAPYASLLDSKVADNAYAIHGLEELVERGWSPRTEASGKGQPAWLVGAMLQARLDGMKLTDSRLRALRHIVRRAQVGTGTYRPHSWFCPQCGSESVACMTWVDPNTRGLLEPDEMAKCLCLDCGAELGDDGLRYDDDLNRAAVSAAS